MRLNSKFWKPNSTGVRRNERHQKDQNPQIPKERPAAEVVSKSRCGGFTNVLPLTFSNPKALATHFRDLLKQKKYILLFAYNGTGKTRLSVEFKDLGKQPEAEQEKEIRDTLYFNAFTEDLFQWNNDLENDTHRAINLNRESHFLDGLGALEMESKIGSLLARYVDFNFIIDYTEWSVTFFREVESDGTPKPTKISRGEESIFVWCFFLAIGQLAIDQQEGSPYA